MEKTCKKCGVTLCERNTEVSFRYKYIKGKKYGPYKNKSRICKHCIAKASYCRIFLPKEIKNRLRIKTKRKSNDSHRRQSLIYSRKAVNDISDTYIKKVIKKQYKDLKTEDITKELIELKRKKIETCRLKQTLEN